jgi:hypothetical protein
MRSCQPGFKFPSARLMARAVAVGIAAAGLSLTTSSALGANILWVSDTGPQGFSGPGTNQTDQGFITLLQNAGHNVQRFNGPDTAATLLSAGDLAAINTNDLIILARNGASGQFLAGQGPQWNTDITKPLICMSPYFIRTTGPRLGWFAGDVGQDDTPTRWTPAATDNPVTDYIFADVPMLGNLTFDIISEPMDRNTSFIAGAPAAGALLIATATFPREDNGTIATGNEIVGFPAGTVVPTGALPAYRMYFGAGTRESATAPNGIPTYTGRENLTAPGEGIFLRSVEVAINSGVAPSTNSGVATIVSSPANLTLVQGQSNVLSVIASGAGPRLIEWQRDDGAGGFTNITDAFSVFPRSRLPVGPVTLADHNAQFRVVVSNALGMATSAVAQLTVTLDTQPPQVISAGTLDGATVVVCFDEAVAADSALEESNYQFNSGAGPNVLEAVIRPDGRSVLLWLAAPLGETALLDVSYVGDNFSNVPELPYSLTVTNLGLTAVDVGAVNPAGTNAVCAPDRIEISAGGLDIGSTADIMRLASKVVTGDFDARVRLVSFVGTNDHFETTAKALLVARESTAANAAAVNVWATPAPPGDNTFSASYRATAGAATNTFGPSVIGVGYPNAWLRIKRAGNLFTTYSSNNGSDWTTIGSATVALPPALNVGMGAVSHRNGKMVTATFADFRISQGPEDITIRNAAYTGGTFSASFDSQSGVVYGVQFKDSLTTGSWGSLTNITGDGTLKSFTDSAISPAGARFYRITVMAVP